MRLDIDDIIHFKSDHVYLEIKMSSGESYAVRGSLNDYMNKLNDSFFRIHRSYIINLNYLSRLNKIAVYIGESQLPI